MISEPGTDQAKSVTFHSSRPCQSAVEPNRRSLLQKARHLLWSHLRARARGPRRTLRERLHAFLHAASNDRLLRLIRNAAMAAAVVSVLLGTASRASAIELADVVAGEGGFTVHGEGRLASSLGWNIADAGDVNGDGLPDAIVSGLYCPYYCHTVPSYVVFGRTDGIPIDLENVAAGQGGFVIRGESESEYSYSGYSVAGAGDVNGDGLADLLIGASGSWYSRNPGATYVVFGKATTAAVELAAVGAGNGGFVIRGESASDYSGRSVSGAGDVNGDGIPDLLIGAPRADPDGRNYAGASYVVFGKATTEAVELADVAKGQGGFVIQGESAGDRSGWSVSGAGDVNNDGIPDLLIGAPRSNPDGRNYAGTTYVVFGKATTEAVKLADIAAGTGGFAILGASAGERSGESVSGAGDVNGDGLIDLLIGAPQAAPGDSYNAGASYVVFGKATTAAVELTAVAAGNGGFVIRGETEDDRSGRNVSGAGDVNGDGRADLLIGAPGKWYSSKPGSSYVVFGKEKTEAVELAAVAVGQGGFVIRGESVRDWSGSGVSGAGDVNGDGLADLLIGAPKVAPGGRSYAGASYVVLGKATTEAIELTDIAAGQGGHAIRGFESRDFSGLEISRVGDVNGDGIEDLLIGTTGSWYSPGASYVVFGKTTTKAVDLDAIAADEGGFVIHGERGPGRSSHRVSGAGDVNGDGLADLLIGAPGWWYSRNTSASYVVFGKATTTAVELDAVASGEGGFVIHEESEGDQSGQGVSGAGDVNGDGLADIIIGAPGVDSGANVDAGASYVIFGKTTTEAVKLADIATGTGGFTIRGDIVEDRIGESVSGVGDVNNDGIPDILIGAPSVSENYLVFGKATTEAIKISDVAEGKGGFVIEGENAGDRTGQSVSGAGDVNGDGIPDLLIGAPNVGSSYVIFGKATTEAVKLTAVATGTGGFAIHGEDTGDRSGSSVSEAGDVNGDGIPDLIIGAPSAGPEGRREAGKSYLVFGKATTEAIDLAAIATGTGGFALRGANASERTGTSVSGTGDINGDGIPDLAIGGWRGFSYTALDGTAYIVFGFRQEGVPRFRRGEVNGDESVNLADPVAALDYLFRGGDAPACFDAADANDDGAVDISDASATLGYLFLGGNAPPLPGPRMCGPDPTADRLGCERPQEECE